MSAEFRNRSAAFTFRPVIENHDKTRFKVICYSGTPTEDAVTDSFNRACAAVQGEPDPVFQRAARKVLQSSEW